MQHPTGNRDLSRAINRSRVLNVIKTHGPIGRADFARRTGLAKTRSVEKLTDAEILHTRYRLDGTDGEPGNWPNFQLDGFGTWLWALNEHRRQNLALRLSQGWLEAAENLNAPSFRAVRVERWENVASPLLWSHAKYIILFSRASGRHPSP